MGGRGSKGSKAREPKEEKALMSEEDIVRAAYRVIEQRVTNPALKGEHARPFHGEFVGIDHVRTEMALRGIDTRAAQDAVLSRMYRGGQINLSPMHNQLALNHKYPMRKAAALNIGGEAKHLVSINDRMHK